jgi:S1-C subfamily serine protease
MSKEVRAIYLGIASARDHAQGAEVLTVDANSPAARAGVTANDVIARYANEPVGSLADLQRLVSATPPGIVRIGVLRAGKKVTLEVSIAVPSVKKKLSLDVGDVSEVLERKISPALIQSLSLSI